MSHTYSTLYVQIVFAVNHRKNFIKENFRNELEKYICGIIKNKSCTPLSIYCNPDHVHILIKYPPHISLSDLARDIKANSSRFINERKLMDITFNWQRGYGAFSYSQSQIDTVTRYIQNQPIHHRNQSFKEEYLNILRKFEIKLEEIDRLQWIDLE